MWSKLKRRFASANFWWRRRKLRCWILEEKWMMLSLCEVWMVMKN